MKNNKTNSILAQSLNKTFPKSLIPSYWRLVLGDARFSILSFISHTSEILMSRFPRVKIEDFREITGLKDRMIYNHLYVLLGSDILAVRNKNRKAHGAIKEFAIRPERVQYYENIFSQLQPYLKEHRRNWSITKKGKSKINVYIDDMASFDLNLLKELTTKKVSALLDHCNFISSQAIEIVDSRPENCSISFDCNKAEKMNGNSFIQPIEIYGLGADNCSISSDCNNNQKVMQKEANFALQAIEIYGLGADNCKIISGSISCKKSQNDEKSDKIGLQSIGLIDSFGDEKSEKNIWHGICNLKDQLSINKDQFFSSLRSERELIEVLSLSYRLAQTLGYVKIQDWILKSIAEAKCQSSLDQFNPISVRNLQSNKMSNPAKANECQAGYNGASARPPLARGKAPASIASIPTERGRHSLEKRFMSNEEGKPMKGFKSYLCKEFQKSKSEVMIDKIKEKAKEQKAKEKSKEQKELEGLQKEAERLKDNDRFVNDWNRLNKELNSALPFVRKEWRGKITKNYVDCLRFFHYFRKGKLFEKSPFSFAPEYLAEKGLTDLQSRPYENDEIFLFINKAAKYYIKNKDYLKGNLSSFLYSKYNNAAKKYESGASKFLEAIVLDKEKNTKPETKLNEIINRLPLEVKMEAETKVFEIINKIKGDYRDNNLSTKDQIEIYLGVERAYELYHSFYQKLISGNPVLKKMTYRGTFSGFISAFLETIEDMRWNTVSVKMLFREDGEYFGKYLKKLEEEI